jgi:hypothetical protein
MKAAKVISGLLAFFIVAPIWYWLLYRILVAVAATELMWFLYWIYIPVAIFAGILTRIAESLK